MFLKSKDFIKHKCSTSLHFQLLRLTEDKNILQIQQEGRVLLLKSRQKDLEIAIEEVAAEIRRKTYDKFKFLGASPYFLVNKEIVYMLLFIQNKFDIY